MKLVQYIPIRLIQLHQLKDDDPQESHLNVRVFDIRGNEVDVLINEVKMAGNYSIKWDATQFASGVYFMR